MRPMAHHAGSVRVLAAYETVWDGSDRPEPAVVADEEQFALMGPI